METIETISEWRRKDDGVTFYSVARRDRAEVARSEVWREAGETKWKVETKSTTGTTFFARYDTCKMALDAGHLELGHLLDASREKPA